MSEKETGAIPPLTAPAPLTDANLIADLAEFTERSIREHADFRDDIERLSTADSRTRKALRKEIYDTIDARVRNAVKAALASQAAPAPQQSELSDYVLMPKRLTAENGAKGALSGEFKESVQVTCPVCDGSGDDPDFDGDPTEHGGACLECNGEGTVAQNVPVSWDTIKDIYKAAVALLAKAAPAAPVQTSTLSGALNHARDALRFYANQGHFHMHQPDEWDTVSGEPQNFYEDNSQTATVEDGWVAKQALEDIAGVERYASVAAPVQAEQAQAEPSEEAAYYKQLWQQARAELDRRTFPAQAEQVEAVRAADLDAIKAAIDALDAFGNLPDSMIHPSAWNQYDAEVKIKAAREALSKLGATKEAAAQVPSNDTSALGDTGGAK
jgi:hypothetical protein